AVTRVTAVAAGRIVLAVAEMVVHLALQRRLGDQLGQPSQQPALAGQLQPLGPSPIRQLLDLPVHGSKIHSRLSYLFTSLHISHKCLLHLRSYTAKITVPASLRG